MNKVLTITLALIICCVFAFAAGCTQPATPPATPAPAPMAVETPLPPTSAPEMTTLSGTPGPVETLPDAWGVDVKVRSNGEAIDPQIVFTVNGGKGYHLIPAIDATVTRSDGVVENGRIKGPLTIGQTMSLAGTTKTNDRAEVWAVTPNGDRVKIYDAYVCFRCY